MLYEFITCALKACYHELYFILPIKEELFEIYSYLFEHKKNNNNNFSRSE